MKNNLLFKILASIPVILITLYFIPFLGVCLIMFRYFIYNGKKNTPISIVLITVGLLIIIPNLINGILSILKVDTDTIPYLSNIINSNLYKIKFINYGKFLITLGILLLLNIFVLRTIRNKVNNKLSTAFRNYISETQKRDREIAKENDLEIKLKQERAKNTFYVKCPNCGSDNIISEKIGTCNYCRRKIVNKNYKV